MTFQQWMRELNFELGRMAGVDYHDLIDWNYREMYDDDYTPSQAAYEVLADEGFILTPDSPGFYDYMSESDADPGL